MYIATDTFAKSNLLHWSDEEDTLLISYIAKNHVGSWSYISTLLHNRSPQQCFQRAFLLLGLDTAFKFDSFLRVKGSWTSKSKVRINPQNLMELEDGSDKGLLSSKVSKDGDKLKKAKSDATVTKKKKNRPLMVSGVALKRPKPAMYEWMQRTGQIKIIKSHFPEYNAIQRRKHLGKIWWNELSDEDRAPYVKIYREKYEKYKVLKKKAEAAKDTEENALQESSIKAPVIRRKRKRKAPLIVDGIEVKKPRPAFEEWVSMTGQEDITNEKFPDYNDSERRRHLSKIWTEKVSDDERLLYIKISSEKYEKYKVLKKKAEAAEAAKDTEENALQESSIKAPVIRRKRKRKAPLIVDGIEVKKPRPAFDEWVSKTGQNGIAKTKFTEYSPVERRRYLQRLWATEVSDVVKAPFLEVYREKLKEYFNLKKKALKNKPKTNCNDETEHKEIAKITLPEYASEKNVWHPEEQQPNGVPAIPKATISHMPRRYSLAQKKLLDLKNEPMSKPISAFDEWVNATGQKEIAKKLFPGRTEVDTRSYLEQKWLNDICETQKLSYSKLYTCKLREYVAKRKRLRLLRKEVNMSEGGLAHHQQKKSLPNVHTMRSDVEISTYNQQNLPHNIDHSGGQDGSSVLKVNSTVSFENDFTSDVDMNNNQLYPGNTEKVDNTARSNNFKVMTNAHSNESTNARFIHQNVVIANGAANASYNGLTAFLERCLSKTNAMQCTWANIFALGGKKLPNTVASFFMESEYICDVYKDVYDLHQVSLETITRTLFIMDKIAAKPGCNKALYAQLLLVSFQHLVKNYVGLQNPIAPYLKQALMKEINLVQRYHSNKSAAST